MHNTKTIRIKVENDMLCVCDRTITVLYYDSRQELFASLDFYLQIIVSIIYKILDLSIIHNVFCQSLSVETINKTDKLAFVFETFDCIFNVKKQYILSVHSIYSEYNSFR